MTRLRRFLSRLRRRLDWRAGLSFRADDIWFHPED